VWCYCPMTAMGPGGFADFWSPLIVALKVEMLTMDSPGNGDSRGWV